MILRPRDLTHEEFMSDLEPPTCIECGKGLVGRGKDYCERCDAEINDAPADLKARVNGLADFCEASGIKVTYVGAGSYSFLDHNVIVNVSLSVGGFEHFRGRTFKECFAKAYQWAQEFKPSEQRLAEILGLTP